MRPTTEHPASWEALSERLAGYFAARARGLLASEFVLSSRDGEEFGRLLVHGPEGAEFEAGALGAKIERTSRSRHRMLADDAEVLVAENAGSSGTLQAVRARRVYDVRLSLLRNTALATSSGSGEAARITGGLTNRAYRAVFDAGDGGALLAAIFLLYQTVALRRRAFLAGAKSDEAP